MNTQINTLVQGSQNFAGTNQLIRNEIANKVIAENQEKMTIEVKGEKIILSANWSLSRKSVNYFGQISLELYKHFCGDYCLPKETPKAFIQISGDMRVSLTTNTKKAAYQIISNSNVTIL
jgi:hypothetical protein